MEILMYLKNEDVRFHLYFKTRIQDNRIALQLELAVTIYVFGGLKEPVH